jgi:hypothetical protein
MGFSKRNILVVFLFGIIFLSSVSSINSMEINYFFSPNCGHCQKISPFMEVIHVRYSFYNWSFFDTTQTSYDIPGTPTVRIKTSDCRNIELVGSYEIPKYLECELKEQSSPECPTHLQLKRGSYFLE